MKLWWHKLRNWEYWSVNIVYLPTFLVWVWYMLKFWSFKFYKYANPSIKNGGLYGDSKMAIYALLPKGIYPKTVFISKNSKQGIIDEITSNQLQFPLIVKPDIGCRGVGVQKVYNPEELLAYANISEQDFLIQEIIEFPNEIGLFYYRLPTEKIGKISGITLKKFLTVIGNGTDSMEKILKKKPRFEMQIPKLKKHFDLNEILNIGEQHCLVPFGNHNRGTEFLDGKEFITEKLEQTFNSFLKNVDGFYYGRLDIRFNSFEELEEGKNFAIIELNGAKSEPTHIYDPKHSFWYGQREIFRHQKIFIRIVSINIQKVKDAVKSR